MSIFKNAILASMATMALAAPALAVESQDFSNIKSVEIEDFIGTVEIKLGTGAAVTVVKTDGANTAYPVRINARGGALSVKSDQDPDRMRWWDEVNWRIHHNNAFKVFLKDYPTLVVTVPKGTDLSFDDAVILLTGGDIEGALDVSGGFVEGEIGDLKTAQIKIEASADLKLGAIADALSVNIHGSGDVVADAAATTDISIHGSGDVTVGDVDGSAETRIQGSGDVRLGRIGGSAIFEIGGSGDIKTGAVNNGAKISIHGSGDVILASVNGETRVLVHGSGDTRINGGRAEELNVKINGSGDFRLQGLATNPDISVYGSGDVYVRDYEGAIHTRGDGDIHIGGRHFGD